MRTADKLARLGMFLDEIAEKRVFTAQHADQLLEIAPRLFFHIATSFGETLIERNIFGGKLKERGDRFRDLCAEGHFTVARIAGVMV